jgi:hypothetical protein
MYAMLHPSAARCVLILKFALACVRVEQEPDYRRPFVITDVVNRVVRIRYALHHPLVLPSLMCCWAHGADLSRLMHSPFLRCRFFIDDTLLFDTTSPTRFREWISLFFCSLQRQLMMTSSVCFRRRPHSVRARS